jgi:hypothetical protein
MGKHCEAVELLLARMDSNPEEFGDNGRWEGLIIKYRSYLPVQDRTAMEDKINALRLDTFHKAVMSELLAEPSETVVVTDNRYIYQGSSTIPVGKVSAIPLTTGVAAVNASNINLSEGSIKSIAAQLQQYAANTWKP